MKTAFSLFAFSDDREGEAAAPYTTCTATTSAAPRSPRAAQPKQPAAHTTPYVAERSASGDLKTDHTFTGQKSDATGLMYYNARYYDPALGTFVAPDSLIPNPGMVTHYNRFLYARGNPLKYADTSGHIPQSPTGPSDDHAESAQRYWDDC